MNSSATQPFLNNNSTQPILNSNMAQPIINDNTVQINLNDNASQSILSNNAGQQILNNTNHVLLPISGTSDPSTRTRFEEISNDPAATEPVIINDELQYPNPELLARDRDRYWS